MRYRRTSCAAIALSIVAWGPSLARAEVVTSVVGSQLVVTGDAAPNTLAIEPSAEGVLVRGLDGTLVDSRTEVTVSGAKRLKVTLQSGTDRLTLTDVRFPKGIFLRLGDGNDTVVLDRVDGGSTRIRMGDGYDAIRVYGPARYRHLACLTGRGPDSVVVDDVWISGDLYADTGSDDDDLTLVRARIDRDASIYLGGDDDDLVLDDVRVDGDTDLDGEDGEDWLYFYGHIEFDEDVDIDGFDRDDWWR